MERYNIINHNNLSNSHDINHNAIEKKRNGESQISLYENDHNPKSTSIITRNSTRHNTTNEFRNDFGLQESTNFDDIAITSSKDSKRDILNKHSTFSLDDTDAFKNQFRVERKTINIIMKRCLCRNIFLSLNHFEENGNYISTDSLDFNLLNFDLFEFDY